MLIVLSPNEKKNNNNKKTTKRAVDIARSTLEETR